MRLRSLTTFAIAAAAILTASACSDSPVAPTSAIAPTDSASSSLLGGLFGSRGATTIVPLLRSAPLEQDEVVYRTIGILGGTLVLPKSGLTLVVPPLAVSHSTKFKITARKGSYLAYDMEPHGTRFTVPLIATQSLAQTNSRSLLNINLSLGYYEDPSHITSVSELLGAQIDALKLVGIATIPHFSGYIWASGRDDSF